MKKLTHIAAPVALTALLSACATPPGPVGGLADQVKKEVTIALADQTVEGLRDDFEEVRKQFDEVKGQAAPEQLGLMDGLEDGFDTIGKQLDEIGKQTDPTAKLDLANDLKGKLEDLATRLDDLNVKYSYRELTYRFKNLDAVDLTRKSREEYIDALKALFKKGEDEKKYVLETDPREDPTDGQVKSITFFLKNLEDGISDDYRKYIERRIREETNTAEVVPDVVAGMPVVKVASPPRPVIFGTRETEYSSASGKAVEKVSATAIRKCPDVTMDVSTEAIVRQREKATPYYFLDDKKGVLGEGPGTTRTSITFTFPPVPPPNDEKGVLAHVRCKYSPDPKTAYLMVLLREVDEKLPVEYYVAEYHKVTATLPDPTEGGDGSATHIPEPGRLTENKPACPPDGWPGYFERVLEEEAGDCV